MAVAATRIVSIINCRWIVSGLKHAARLRRRDQVPIAELHTSVIKTPAKDTTVKIRTSSGRIAIDEDAGIQIGQNEVFLCSDKLADELAMTGHNDQYLVLKIDRIEQLVRVTAQFVSRDFFDALDTAAPYMRLSVAHGVPPETFVEVTGNDDIDSVYQHLVRSMDSSDPKLQAPEVERFLQAPHIVLPLFSHLSSLSAEENLRFPVEVRRLADQYRELLLDEHARVKIHKIPKSHLNTWAEAQGKAYAFLDGGVARIAGLPGAEPTALRVGIYTAIAGEADLAEREQWTLQPYVVGDIIDKNLGPAIPEDQSTNMRRLAEASRYVLEALTAIDYLKSRRDIAALFWHGPLVNQFQQYDEQEPNFLPCLRTTFLAGHGIAQSAIEAAIGSDMPLGPNRKPLWSHFMAAYGYLMRAIFDHLVPVVGVVERSAGKWIAEAVVSAAVEDRLVKESYKRKVQKILVRYGISDDFLFGCVLREGEYVTPVSLDKNPVRRARPQWQAAISRYPSPFATVLKTEETSFPFRVELNRAGSESDKSVMAVLYHTARLLPRYAFPVGLDIVDKYAKVPDWLSRNVSARLAATVLSRAMAEGNANVVMQIRQLLAHTPRDFFYRPQS